MPDEIKIMLNGFVERLSGRSSLSQLIADRGDGDAHLIVELNGRFIYPKDYSETVVEDGDRVELIHPNFGG